MTKLLQFTPVNNAETAAITEGAPSESHIGEVGTNGAIVGVELTRPADTSAYAINDAVTDSDSAPTNLTFANLARANAQSGYIVKARLMTNKNTTDSFRLHLFHTAPTAINDNSPYTLLYDNKANRVGYIDFPALSTEGTGSDCAGSLWTGQIHFVCAAASRALYGVLEAKTALAPNSGQKFYIELSVDNN